MKVDVHWRRSNRDSCGVWPHVPWDTMQDADRRQPYNALRDDRALSSSRCKCGVCEVCCRLRSGSVLSRDTIWGIIGLFAGSKEDAGNHKKSKLTRLERHKR